MNKINMSASGFSLQYHTGGSAAAAAAAAKLLQSCLTLCDPIDGSSPGSPVPGILQARTLEWVAISSSNAWKWKGKGKSLSRVRLLATPRTAAHQAPLSIGFSRQEYWSGVPLPSPKGLLGSVIIRTKCVHIDVCKHRHIYILPLRKLQQWMHYSLQENRQWIQKC